MRLIKLCILIMILLPAFALAKKRPPDWNPEKEIYIDLNRSFSSSFQDIENEGYRFSSIDTVKKEDSAIVIVCKGKIYRPVFGMKPDKFVMTVLNDTIFEVSLYYSDWSNPDNADKLIKKISTTTQKHSLDVFHKFDKEACGENYQSMSEFIFRYQSIQIFNPVDLAETPLKLIIIRSSFGKAMEDFENAYDSIMNKKKPQKKK